MLGAQSCLIFCDPVDSRPQGLCPWDLQTRILAWAAILLQENKREILNLQVVGNLDNQIYLLI